MRITGTLHSIGEHHLADGPGYYNPETGDDTNIKTLNGVFITVVNLARMPCPAWYLICRAERMTPYDPTEAALKEAWTIYRAAQADDESTLRAMLDDGALACPICKNRVCLPNWPAIDRCKAKGASDGAAC